MAQRCAGFGHGTSSLKEAEHLERATNKQSLRPADAEVWKGAGRLSRG